MTKLNEQDKQFNKIMDELGEEARLSFIYSMCFCEIAFKMITNRTLDKYKLIKYFMNEYIINYSTFDWKQLAKCYLVSKLGTPILNGFLIQVFRKYNKEIDRTQLNNPQYFMDNSFIIFNCLYKVPDKLKNKDIDDFIEYVVNNNTLGTKKDLIWGFVG